MTSPWSAAGPPRSTLLRARSSSGLELHPSTQPLFPKCTWQSGFDATPHYRSRWRILAGGNDSHKALGSQTRAAHQQSIHLRLPHDRRGVLRGHTPAIQNSHERTRLRGGGLHAFTNDRGHSLGVFGSSRHSRPNSPDRFVGKAATLQFGLANNSDNRVDLVGYPGFRFTAVSCFNRLSHADDWNQSSRQRSFRLQSNQMV